MPRLTPAVAYYRMSTDKQETSIRDQRVAVEKYAQDNNYQILREYADEGISGWKSSQRKQFTQLIADAADGEFTAVLCWDQDRFSRFDPLEANHYWYLLDQAGVHLATVAQGRLDWHDLGGWLSASVQQHGKAQYVKDLSRNAARGIYAAKKSGKWFGRPPFGYVLADSRLQPGAPADVALVRRLFDERARGLTLTDIALRLNAEGIPTPNGAKWRTSHVQTILERPAYKGATPISLHGSAKFFRTTETPEVVEGTHKPLVSVETWDKVQAIPKLIRKGKGQGGSPGGRLSGLVFCNRCGGPMYCIKRGTDSIHYLCRNYTYNREHSGEGKCGYCRVDAAVLERSVFTSIRENVLCGSRDRLVAAIQAEMNRRGKRKSTATDYRRQISKLTKQIESASERLLLIDADLLAGSQAKLREMIEQRDRLIDSQAKQRRQRGTEKSAEDIADLLWELPARLAQHAPPAARVVLSQIIDRIDLDFERLATKPGAKNKRFRCTGGRLHLQSAAAETCPS